MPRDDFSPLFRRTVRQQRTAAPRHPWRRGLGNYRGSSRCRVPGRSTGGSAHARASSSQWSCREIRRVSDKVRKPWAKPGGIQSCFLFSALRMNRQPTARRFSSLFGCRPRHRRLHPAPRAPACPGPSAASGSAGRAGRSLRIWNGCPARRRRRGRSPRSKARALKLSKKKPRSSPKTFGSRMRTSGMAVGVTFIRTPCP